MDLITTTFGQFLEKWAQLTPNKDFIVYPDRGLRFSYKTFNERVDNLAKSLLHLGIRKGDKIGIFANNVPDWLTYFFATANAIDAQGWLHSGDLGVMDENGYFRVTGRIKDMIIRGGENIYPREIENFLYTHPEIEAVEVAGVASEKYGEEVCAFIRGKSGSQLSEEDVIDFCRGKIARFKIPRYIFFVNEFPMTASGKIQKYKLREMAAEMIR